jgi:hypothetical protein
MKSVKDTYMHVFLKKNGTQEIIIKNKYPELHDSIYKYTKNLIDINWNERLYLFFTQSSPLTCKNCKKPSKFNSIGAGYFSFCSRKCINDYAKTNTNKKKKIQETLLKKSSIEVSKKFGMNITSLPNKYFLIKSNCEHGDVLIKRKVFNKIYKSEIKIYCFKCREKYLLSDNKLDVSLMKQKINTIPNSDLGQIEYLKLNHLDIFKTICDHSLHISDISWAERIYLFKNSLSFLPKCKKLECNKKVKFNHSMMQYNNFCNIHSNTSNQELELRQIILNFGEYTEKYKDKKYEIDIFIPEKHIGIEFNGIYWHSEKFKNKQYHYNKWKYFNDKKIKLITIWEDDWNSKQDLIKSMIKNQLMLNENKIYGRKTEIREIDFKTSKEFLEKNHIQGNSLSSIRLGLYHNIELISLMTFGKRNIGKKTQFELLRFCNKQNTTIVGGASKLFKYFINNYNPLEVISYANLDISNGKLYDTLGFTNEGHTGVNYWWVKDKRYHRSNFMKHKLVAEGADPAKTENEIMRERGYNKIYGNGNLKFIYRNVK